jgi:hypothetical protein
MASYENSTTQKTTDNERDTNETDTTKQTNKQTKTGKIIIIMTYILLY